MVRLATIKDTSQVKDLWRNCFDDTKEFIDFYFDECYEAKNTLVIFDGHKLCSSLQLRPYEIMIRETRFKVYYIVGVATWPEYRKRGYVTKLIKHAGKIMDERGYYISILLPFDYSFYRRYGWEVCYDLLHYVDLDLKVSKLDINSNDFFSISPGGDLRHLNDLYEAYVNQNHGYITRNDREWDIILNDFEIDGGSCYLYKKDRLPQGYVLLTKEDTNIVIRELAYGDPNVLNKIIAFVLKKAEGQKVLWKAPISDATYANKHDFKMKIPKQAYVMGRIHNVPTSLSGIRSGNEHLIVKVIDSFFTENDGCFLFKGVGGRLLVERVDEEPDLQLGIQSLTQVFWGNASVDHLVEKGLLKVYSKEALRMLAGLFPTKNNYIMEDF